ncbi:ParA family protein [Paenibacillus campi]|uniref:ParA family protein n=1 Tax=Paenibacillus campi TaxID=3106031 RepID=UPI002AFE1A7D|nr:AAA family ATPase [Paenibacillus sp. SGZ-1014]
MKIISLFNNKGGVGKTTYLYHIAHILAENYKVLMIDCDSQCNLSSYCLTDTQIEKEWKEDGRSIYRIVEDLIEGLGDFKKRNPLKLSENLYLTPGDIEFSLFEDKLANTWTGARAGESGSLRLQSAIYRYAHWLNEEREYQFDFVLMDLGPNLGSLNRSNLISSDYFIVPVAPDLFSIRGTENLGRRISEWSTEWKLTQEHREKVNFKFPEGKPKFLGYVVQSYNLRKQKDDNNGMTRGWGIYGSRLERAIEKNIISKLAPLSQLFEPEINDFKVATIPNLNSLIPYSMEARKPVYKCTYNDGLVGSHITKASESKEKFETILEYTKYIL